MRAMTFELIVRVRHLIKNFSVQINPTVKLMTIPNANAIKIRFRTFGIKGWRRAAIDIARMLHLDIVSRAAANQRGKR
jgi:hypothetical protein